MRGVNATPSNPLMEAIHSETTLILSSLLARTLQANNALALNIESLLYYIPLHKRSYENTKAKLIQLEAVQLDCHHLVQNRQQSSTLRGNVTKKKQS